MSQSLSRRPKRPPEGWATPKLPGAVPSPSMDIRLRPVYVPPPAASLRPGSEDALRIPSRGSFTTPSSSD